jgi:hypothetical protein
MTWNAGAWNATPWNAPAGGVLGTGTVAVTVEQRVLLGLGTVRATIEQQIANATGTITLSIQQRVVTRGVVAVTVEQQVELAAGTVRATIEQRIVTTGALTLPIEQRIADADADGLLTGPGARAWTLRCTLAGADVSAALTGVVRVEAEESRARVAEFTLRPAAGAVDLTAWVGAAVVLEVSQQDQPWTRLFTGWVDVPEYDPVTRLTTYHCHDRLQERLDAMSRAQLAALIGGEWSAGVFRDDVTGYEHAQDRLSTVPAALDAGPDGVLRVTPWAATSPAWTLTEAHIVDESLRVELASRADLANRITITAEARFQRRSHRQRSVSWRYHQPPAAYGFVPWLLDNTTLPTEEMIRSAADQSGWAVTRESFTRLPGTTTVQVGGGETRIWVHNPEAPPFMVLEATLSLARRWATTITEVYTLRVEAPASVALWGLAEQTENANLSAEGEADWEIVSDPTNGTGIAPYDDLAGATVDPTTGDRYFDDAPRADVDAMVRAAVARARVRILESHRRHLVEATVPLLADLDLAHTLRVATDAVTATGKVRQLAHEMDIESGQALTLARLAVSRGGAAVAETPVAAPAPPAVAQPDAGPGLGTLDTHLGRRALSPPESETWTGYVGNYVIPIPAGAPAYEERFVIDLGEIPRDPVEAPRAAGYVVNVPSDELALAA